MIKIKPLCTLTYTTIESIKVLQFAESTTQSVFSFEKKNREMSERGWQEEK